ncbi:hypothetical protein [Tetragenococcus halophilus]|uniref:Uncharacterized protein n=2 Tax=Tetragenococcus muriaticus TaxID=64642 RepID=A0A091C1Z9_9ENTE|nr:hypothetical protein [Tetragenococcus halophilus]KFN91861.1 hypothetical protein TMU3MR103_0819 [Tetragenococcus muriaticus 3MR10-3]MDN6167150.1 hypothetical protein [Tetragenococcus koreensis]MCF1601690.1 hypothetical protein [Tetragenococcus halophilus]MDN6268444.1 hypothetical protein [Tetragenococcus koreensis]MDN6736110.1 hypothetical protein [Tetragenococcus koreensis]
MKKKVEMIQIRKVFEVGEENVTDIEALDKNYPCVKVHFEDGLSLEISGDYKLLESTNEDVSLPIFL